MRDDDIIKDEDLDEVATISDYADFFLVISSKILECSKHSVIYREINMLTTELDEVALMLRHSRLVE